ncbi:MAG: alkaline phosphatase D family protein, partial [Robiginitomaculum sp.]|nr:alkaline phosphatase D family protein [Robiginitomaculum sp.]
IWDDHETASDSWKTGAENHNKGEGDWDTRRANAMQAYYEWMPIRDPKPGQAREALFRNYEFGDLFSLTSIETRLTARTRAIDYARHMESFKTRKGIENFYKTVLHDPTNEMMGQTQQAFVENALKTSKNKGLTWRLIANQILMGRINTPDLTSYEDEDFITELEKLAPQIRDFIKISPLGLPLNPDAWDGYPQARERFYQMVQNQNVRDLLVLTGDTHDCWVNTLETASGTSMGIELGTSGVTSPGTGTYFASAAQDFSKRLSAKNPGILYHENQYHGYIDLSLTHEQGQVDFVNVDTVYTPKYKTFISKSIKLSKHDETLKVDEV